MPRPGVPQPGAKLALVVVLVLGADASAVATGPLVALDGADGRQEWHYNFVGRRMPPVNNSLDAMVRSGLLSDHCIDKLESGFDELQSFRARARGSFAELGPLNGCGGAFKPFVEPRDEEAPVSVVFSFMVHSSVTVALESADRLLEAASDRFQPLVLLHVDASSDEALHHEVAGWVAEHPDHAAAVDPPIDVEYGGISQASAWLVMMRHALSRWPRLDTFATLSETHALISDPAAVAEFFTRHVGLSFPGRDIQTSASEEHISHLLNDVVFSCDGGLYHVGWRDDPTPPDPIIRGGETWSFWSADFVRWVTEEPNALVDAMIDVLKYSLCSDEYMLPSMFFASPYCRDQLNPRVASIYTALVWMPECYHNQFKGKPSPEYCGRLQMDPFPWWGSQRPLFLKPSDAPWVVRQTPMFARKVEPNEDGLATVRQLRQARAAFDPDSVSGKKGGKKGDEFYITSRRLGKCLAVDPSGNGGGWVSCQEKGITTFQLYGCIGTISVVEGRPVSATLDTGELFGHCMIKATGTHGSVCLSLPPDGAWNNPRLDPGPFIEKWVEDDGAKATAGIAPCTPTGTGQTFVFRPGGILEIALRSSRSGGAGLCVDDQPSSSLRIAECGNGHTRVAMITPEHVLASNGQGFPSIQPPNRAADSTPANDRGTKKTGVRGGNANRAATPASSASASRGMHDSSMHDSSRGSGRRDQRPSQHLSDLARNDSPRSIVQPRESVQPPDGDFSLLDLPPKPDEPPEVVYNRELGLMTNNSMDDLASSGLLNADCRKKLKKRFAKVEKYRMRPRSSFADIASLNACPPVKTDVDLVPVRWKTGPVEVIFAILTHSNTVVPFDTAERILASATDSFRPRVIFHVDKSSPKALHAAVKAWVKGHAAVAMNVDHPVDVEYLGMSQTKAWFAMMRLSLRRFPHFDTFVTLSESHALIGSPERLAEVFTKHVGLTFPGLKSSASLNHLQFLINDVTFPCGGKLLHVGWRNEPLNPLTTMRGGEEWGFYSGDWVRWAIGRPNALKDALVDLFSYSACSVENVLGALFHNSPFCRQHIAGDPIYNFSTVMWDPTCHGSTMEGKKPPAYCGGMDLNPLGWWALQRPSWLTVADVPYITRQNPLFVRKIKADGSALETIRLLRRSQQQHTEATTLAGAVFVLRRAGRVPGSTLCMQLDPRTGGGGWAECSHGFDEASRFRLRDCIGDVQIVNGRPRSGTVQGGPTGQSWYGHCIVEHVGLKNGPRFCLSLPPDGGWMNLRHDPARFIRKFYDESRGGAVGLGACDWVGRGQTYVFDERGHLEVATRGAHPRNRGLCVVCDPDDPVSKLAECERMQHPVEILSVDGADAALHLAVSLSARSARSEL